MSVSSALCIASTGLVLALFALPAGAQDAPASATSSATAPEASPPRESTPRVESETSPLSQDAAAAEPRSEPAQPETLALAAGAGGEEPALAEPTAPQQETSENEPPLAEAEPKTEAVPEWTRSVRIGGGAIIYYYQPLEGDAKNNVSVFFANLLLDGRWGAFGLHIEPRFRDSKLRPFFDGPAWLQEAYGSFTYQPVTLKVGKVYKQLGLFWDNSFYGNVQVYDGLKLDPNYGVSLEGSAGDGLGADFSAQYFVVDGSTNVSLQGRDTISIAGARRRNSFTGRIEPFFVFGAGDAGQVRAGVSAELLTADLPGDESRVRRVAGHGKLTYDTKTHGAVGVWGEYLHQDGNHVTDFPFAGEPDATPPLPGRASGKNDYLLVGGEYSYWRLSARYNVSRVRYGDVDVEETLHVPALGVRFDDHLRVLAEYVLWTRDTPSGTVDVDRSLNVTFHGAF